MVIVPSIPDKDTIDIDWDDDDDFGNDITDDGVKTLVDSTSNKDVIKSSKIDDDVSICV
jgi:hypothetical protein